MSSIKPFYLIAIAGLIVTAITSCGNKKREFNRVDWSYGDGLQYPSRDAILDDLLANHKIVGLNHYQVIQLLGSPQDRDIVNFKYAYQIVNTGADYNPKKNPVYKKDLIIYFNKDSVVIKKEIVEKNKEFK